MFELLQQKEREIASERNKTQSKLEQSFCFALSVDNTNCMLGLFIPYYILPFIYFVLDEISNISWALYNFEYMLLSNECYQN